MTAADIRYGRRGGGWAPNGHDPMAPADPAPAGDRPLCAVCGRPFYARSHKGRPLPEICGQVACRARHTWGPDDWEGRTRMARARRAAGVPLDDLDLEALRRTEGTQT